MTTGQAQMVTIEPKARAWNAALAFFGEQAGCHSFDPRRETSRIGQERAARELAAAEQYASLSGWDAITFPDDDDTADDDTATTTGINEGSLLRLVIAVRDEDGGTLAMMGSVIVPSEDDPTVRVIAAQLALEAMDRKPDVRPPLQWDSDAADLTSIRANLFGRLVELSAPVIEHYRSDLFHDAQWLAKHVDRPMTFYWAYNDCGTSIGTGRQEVVEWSHREHAFRVTLDRTTRGYAYVTIAPEPR